MQERTQYTRVIHDISAHLKNSKLFGKLRFLSKLPFSPHSRFTNMFDSSVSKQPYILALPCLSVNLPWTSAGARSVENE